MSIGTEFVDSNWPRAAREFGSAIKLLGEARQLNPRYLSARFNLAKAWFRLEDVVAASEEVGELFKLPLNKAWAELCAITHAECLNRVAAFRECWEVCDKWLGEFPDSIGLQRVRAETIVDGFCIGKEKDGVRVVEESSLGFFSEIVRDEQKRTVSDLRYLARLKEWMGEVKTAVDLLDKAEQLLPNHWEVPFNLATLYWRRGELCTALYYAQKACTLGPWVPQTWRAIALIQGASQLHKEAEESRNRAEEVTKRRKEITQSATGR